jgi:hypothetical protein
VDDRRNSRLSTGQGAAYYLSTLLLQLIPFTIAGGTGLSGGWAWRRQPKDHPRSGWSMPPRRIIMDALLMYILIVPLFLIASLWEFLAPWR